MYTILLIVIAFLLFYYYLVKPQCYWREKNVKQGPPIPILGDHYKVLLGMETLTDMVKRCYGRFKNARYVGIYQTTLPTLLLRDPELIKQITVKDFDHFLDHRSFVPDTADTISSKNLFSLKGDHWKEMRSTLSPTFTASKMRSMFILMENSARQFIDYYLQEDKPVIELELKDSFTRFANDVIANCAFGVTVDSLKDTDNSFYLNGIDLTNQVGLWKLFKFLLTAMAPKISNFFKISIFSKKATDFFKVLVRDTVKIRQDQGIVRPDMINLLLEARKGRLKYEESMEQKDAGFATAEESDVGKKQHTKLIEMNDDDIAGQMLIFFFAGFETISSMMSFMYYELAVHPEIQDRLIQEIDKTRIENKGELTYDILNKMKYMDMVITENLRKNSPADAIDRVCTKDYTIQPQYPDESPLHLKKGDVIWLPITGIHYNEKYFPNPNKFDPERFSDENKSNIVPYTYIPFGSGPRNCIGSRFALMEIKTLMFHVLSNFEIVVIEKTPIPAIRAKRQLTPSIVGGFWVGLKRRVAL